MTKITSVSVGDDYLLTVRLNNNRTVTVDLKQKLHTVRFSELKDKELFRAVRTDGKAVYWPGGTSLAISELLELAAK
jgi:Protein of unknown function (DUF2442).